MASSCPTYLDTGHVLTTGGSDPGGSNVNESLNWRPIGTTGEDNPTGASVSLIVNHNLPATGYDIDPTTISPTPASSSASTIEWQGAVPTTTPETDSVTGQVTDMAPGEVRAISTGTSVTAYYYTASGQTVSTTIDLPPVTVAAEHIVGLTDTQTVNLGSEAAFTVQLTNPYSTDVTYNLATEGLDGFTVNLASSVTVPAGQTVTTPLDLSIPLNASADTTGFEVLASTAGGVSDSVEGELTVAQQVALQTSAVSLGLSPVQTTAGQGGSAEYVLTVTNVGRHQDSYSLTTSGLPSGVSASLGETTIDVPPGTGNFRDVPLDLAVAKGTAPAVIPSP